MSHGKRLLHSDGYMRCRRGLTKGEDRRKKSIDNREGTMWVNVVTVAARSSVRAEIRPEYI
jgi:hypothetical protein